METAMPQRRNPIDYIDGAALSDWLKHNEWPKNPQPKKLPPIIIAGTKKAKKKSDKADKNRFGPR